jgi:hypothetical protein
MKLDLSKAYDRVLWTFFHLMLLQIGFSLKVVKWIMGCISSTQMMILINRFVGPLFKPSRGFRQGFPLSPFLFLLVAEGLSRCIQEEKSRRLVQGVLVGRRVSISHLLFVDDIILFFYGSMSEVRRIINILELCCSTTSMEINNDKYVFYASSVDRHLQDLMTKMVPFQQGNMEDDIKYISFTINPNH